MKRRWMASAVGFPLVLPASVSWISAAAASSSVLHGRSAGWPDSAVKSETHREAVAPRVSASSVQRKGRDLSVFQPPFHEQRFMPPHRKQNFLSSKFKD